MTNPPYAATEGGIRPSQIARTPHTLRLRQIMEEAQRLEIAARIRDLRERSRFTQPQVAERLGLTLRGYQKLEEKGTTKWERCGELAEVFEVDARWIWDGSEKGETPDVLRSLSENSADELARLSDAVEQLRVELAAARNELLAEIAQVRRAQEAPQKRRGNAGRSQGGSGN